MPRIRVLVVEDSLTVRRQLCDVLSADPDLEVVGEADDGKRAIELCAALRPDVITLDMMLPVMSGLSATEYIMAHSPTPILIVSSSLNRGEVFKTYDALAAGAVDVMEKPVGNEPPGVWETGFIAAVKLVSRIRVITHPRAKLSGLSRIEATRTRPVYPATTLRPEIIAIGASTGGPGAIVEVLREIPATLPTPILVVLHINEPFGSSFAEWLDAQTEHRVSFARDGQPFAAGVTMAPPDRHLIVSGGRLRLNRDPERHSCRPSVDILFESIASQMGSSAVGCLLTGMGRDGASGLLQIRSRGGITIAQDEASCVVYGMPREAVLLDAATHVLPLREIGSALTKLVEESR
jgi:two-component system, chemotaxis family, protein-glutamate methylesterase/glutaminase